MFTTTDFNRVRQLLGAQAEDDIAWADSTHPPVDADEFAREVLFVICNSGMHHRVAWQIFVKVMNALKDGKSASTVFRHCGKAQAMDYIWAHRESLWQAYMEADNKLDAARDLPWIGDVTKYHVVKNFGEQVCKPDVHLMRLAEHDGCGCTPQELCERIASAVKLSVIAVDTVLWRACANGLIDARTGAVVDA